MEKLGELAELFSFQRFGERGMSVHRSIGASQSRASSKREASSSRAIGERPESSGRSLRGASKHCDSIGRRANNDPCCRGSADRGHDCPRSPRGRRDIRRSFGIRHAEHADDVAGTLPRGPLFQKSQISNPKNQIPNKFKIPNHKRRPPLPCLEFDALVLVCVLEFVIWCLSAGSRGPDGFPFAKSLLPCRPRAAPHQSAVPTPSPGGRRVCASSN